ncbi:hypothetical protein HK096_003600 [Nowakowskiella sp. JEL0078]|nr:hypothetical protein HK096_003600 [Nowakowskiella sp. JEL0078]
MTTDSSISPVTKLSPIRIAIIGGGIGGAALAHGLMKDSKGLIRVTVYERDSGLNSRPQGYQIGLNSDGLHALIDCCGNEPDVLKQLGELFTETSTQGFSVYDQDLSPIMSVGIKKVDPQATLLVGEAALKHYSKWGGTIDRWVFHNILIGSLLQNSSGDENTAGIKYSKKFSKYEVIKPLDVQGQTKVKLHFDDESIEEADIVIGADGARSKMRIQRTPNLEFKPYGVMNIGGYVDFFSSESKFPKTHKAVFGSPSSSPRPPYLVRATSEFGISVLLLPFKSELDDKNKLILACTFGTPDKDTMKFISENNLQKMPNDDQTSLAKRVKDICIEKIKFAGFDQEILTLYNEMPLENVMDYFSLDVNAIVPTSTNPFTNSSEVDKAERGRVTLIGDALHAMSTHRGLGANTALQDAQDLANTIKSCLEKGFGNVNTNHVAKAIELVENTVIVPRGFKNVKNSLQSTDMMCAAGSSVKFQRMTMKCIGAVLWFFGY